MIYITSGISLLFLAIGFILTKNNAKYLLAGYNTMSEEKRRQLDIQPFLLYFRKFHIFLGLSFFIISSILIYVVSEKAGGLFISIYPILAYLYFFWSSAKYTKGINRYPMK